MDELCIKRIPSAQLHLLTVLHSYNNTDDMLAQNSKKINNGDIDIFGLFLDNALIGEIRVAYNKENTVFAQKGTRAYLYAFRILKDYRSKGFGSYLLSNVISILKCNGYTEFTIGVEDDNPIAKKLYKDFGFDIFLDRISEEYQGDSYEYNLYLKK